MDESDFFRLYARDVGVSPPFAGATDVQAALGVAGAGLQSAVATFTNAQLATLFSNPPVLLAAPGAGLAISPVSFRFQVNFSSGNQSVNSGGGDHLAVYYGPNDTAHTASSPSTVIAQGTTGVPDGPIEYLTPTGTTAALAENEPLTVACLTADPAPLSGIATADVAFGGTGYAVGDTGTIDTDAFVGGAVYVVATETLGVVGTITLTAPGDGYAVADSPFTTTPGGSQPGGGTGLTIDALTLLTPTSTLTVEVTYRIVAV